MKSFTKSLFGSFELGEEKVHSALLRYNAIQDTRFTFKSSNNHDDVMDAIDATVYDGSGTKTGEAITYSILNLLAEETGRRVNVPGLAVIITDGKSQDDVAGPSEALRSTGMTTIAVGIGNVDRAEILDIAGSQKNTFITESFDDLISTVLDQVTQAACEDEDECLVDNGGCSDTCNKVPGSYYCTCPEGSVIDLDMKTCVEDDGRVVSINECLVMNGGCSHGCVDTLSGYNCTCPQGYALEPTMKKNCFDINECDNSVCSDGCVNTDGSFYCECPPSHSLSMDGVTCLERVGVVDCPAGYVALAHSCMRYNEAADYIESDLVCSADGGSLVNVSDEGVLTLVARKYQSFFAASTIEEQLQGNCSSVSNEAVVIKDCSSEMPSVCEIRRDTGLVLFSRTWPNGAQGSLYLPTDQYEVVVRFPSAVKKVTAWFCSAKPVVGTGRREYTFTQNYIEMTSSSGQCEFTVDMKERFADYDVTVVA